MEGPLLYQTGILARKGSALDHIYRLVKNAGSRRRGVRPRDSVAIIRDPWWKMRVTR